MLRTKNEILFNRSLTLVRHAYVILAAVLAQAQLQPLPAAAAATAAALPGAAAPQEPSEGAGATAGNATSQPSYSSIFSAVMAMNETRNVQQIYVAIGAQGITPDLIARYESFFGALQNPDATLTAFFPTNQGWDRQLAYLCLTFPELLSYMTENPYFGADGWMAMVFNTSAPLYAEDFRDGLVLQSLLPGFNVTMMHRLNMDGSSTWYLANASFNGSDVEILPTNISAGRGVIHETTSLLADAPLQQEAQQIRANHSANCTSGPFTAANSSISYNASAEQQQLPPPPADALPGALPAG